MYLLEIVLEIPVLSDCHYKKIFMCDVVIDCLKIISNSNGFLRISVWIIVGSDLLIVNLSLKTTFHAIAYNNSYNDQLNIFGKHVISFHKFSHNT